MATDSGCSIAPGESHALRYGTLVTLYDRSVEGYVVPSYTSEAPVSVQREDGSGAFTYESAVFQILPAFAGSSGGSHGTAGAAGLTQAQLGEVVRFGQTVRLVHHARQQCLAHHCEQHAIGLKGNLRVQLHDGDDDPRVTTCWRLLPRYRMRTEGEIVTDGDAVVLISADDGHILNRADRYTGESSHDHAFLEVSCGAERQPFEMRLYDASTRSSGNTEADGLHFGDVIVLMHTETGMLLQAACGGRRCRLENAHTPARDATRTAHLCGIGALAEGSSDNMAETDHVTVPMSEAEPQSLDALTVPSLFVIEALNPSRGGRVNFAGTCTCRLRSLATGLYLQTGVDELREAKTQAPLPADRDHSENKTRDQSVSLADDPTAHQSAQRHHDAAVEGVAPFSGPSPQLTSPALRTLRTRHRLDSLVELNDIAFVPRDTDAQLDESGPTAAMSAIRFTASANAARNAVGTVFRLHALSEGRGQRVLLEALPSRRSGRASLWLAAGPPSASVDDTLGDDYEEVPETLDRTGAAVAASSHTAPSSREVNKTIGSLTEEKNVSAADLYFTARASTSDVLEVHRLHSRAVRDVVTVQTLLRPLADYCNEMQSDTLANAFRVREVLENITVLRTTLRVPSDDPAALPSSAVVRAAKPVDTRSHKSGASGYRFTLRGTAAVSLNAGPGHLESLLDTAWQVRLFQLGVVDAIVALVTATLECPLLPAPLLFSEDVVTHRAVPTQKSNSQPQTSDATSPSVEARHRRSRGPLQRYSDFGKLVNACLLCLSEIVRDQPELSATRQAAMDALMPWCESVPSLLPCLATVYEGNPVFVELPLARRRLEFFLRLLRKRGPDASVLTILRLFALCGEESMSEAQGVMIDFFLKNPQVRTEALCAVKLLEPAELLSTAPAGAPEAGNADASLEASTRPLSPVISATSASSVMTAPDAASSLACSPSTAPPAANVHALSALVRPYIVKPSPVDAASDLYPVERIAVLAIPNCALAPRDGDAESLLNPVPPSISTGAYGTHARTVFGVLLLRAFTAMDDSGVTHYPLEGLRALRTECPQATVTIIPTLVAQVRLLAALSSGRQARACQLLVPLCVPTALLSPGALVALHMPSAVHAAFLDLFTHVCVDCEGAFALHVDLTRIRCALAGADEGRGEARYTCDNDGRRVASTSPASLPGEPRKARRSGEGKEGADENVEAPTWHTMHFEAPLVSTEQHAAKAYALRYLSNYDFAAETSKSKGDVSRAVMDLLTALVRCGTFTLYEYDALATVLARVLDRAAPRRLPEATRPGPAGHRAAEVGAVRNSRTHQSTRLSALTLLHLLADVLTAAQALAVVTALRPGHPAPAVALTQLLSFRPHTAAAPDSATTAPTCSLLDVLQRIAASHTQLTLRPSAVALFYRLTNFAADLVHTVQHVQTSASHESLSLYRTLDQLATELQSRTNKSLSRANALAQTWQLLEQLEALQDSRTATNDTAEWLAMVHHVDLEKVLVRLLLALPVPLKGRARRLSTYILTMLKSWMADDQIADVLRTSAERLAPLASYDRTTLSLLRGLYVPTCRCGATRAVPLGANELAVPSLLVDQVVRCFRQPGLLADALAFLVDLLTYAATLPERQTFLQKQVWLALVRDTAASSMIDFSETWCSLDNGARYREEMLVGSARTSDEATEVPKAQAEVCLTEVTIHLRLCHLIYLIAHQNDLVHPEQIRHELFGRSSVDMVLSVLTDDLLPVTFRFSYLRFMVVLLLEDHAAVPEVMMHPRFLSFLRTCALDLYAYMQLCGGALSSAELEEELERRQSLTVPCGPIPLATLMDVDDDGAQTGGRQDEYRASYAALVYGPLCESLSRLCPLFSESIDAMSTRVQSQVKLAINECLDALADLSSFLCEGRRGDTGGSDGMSSVAGRSTLTQPSPSQSDAWSLETSQVVLRVWETAVRFRFQGTTRWRGRPLACLMDSLRRIVESKRRAERDAAPNHQTPTLAKKSCASLPPGLPLYGSTVTPLPGVGLSALDRHRDARSPLAAASSSPPSVTESVFEGITTAHVGLEGSTQRTTLSPHVKPLAATYEAVVPVRDTPASLQGGETPAPGELLSTAQSALNTQAHISSVWRERVQNWTRTAQKENAPHDFVSTAGVVLRSGEVGTRFLYTVVSSLPKLSPALVVATLRLVQKVVTLQPYEAHDESGKNQVAWGGPAPTTATGAKSCASQGVDATRPFTCGMNCLSLYMPVRQRQSLLARWRCEGAVDSQETPAPLLALIVAFIGTTSSTITRAALSTAITLLTGGHRAMQQSYVDYMLQSQRETLFYVVRTQLTACSADLRGYRSALEHGSTPTTAAYHLAHLADASLSLRLLQLLCMGQYAPMQILLAAQPHRAVSVNLLEPMVELLCYAVSGGSTLTAPFFVQLLATISESMLGPCVANQDRLVALGLAHRLTHVIHVRYAVEHAASESPAASPSSSMSGDRPYALAVSPEIHTHEEAANSVMAANDVLKDRHNHDALSSDQSQALQARALFTLLALIEGRREPEFMRAVVASTDLTALVSRMDESAALYERRRGRVSPRQSGWYGVRTGLGSLKAAVRDYYYRRDVLTDEAELRDELNVAAKIFRFLRACYDVQNLQTLATTRRGEGKARLLFDALSSEFLDAHGRTVTQVARTSQSFAALAKKIGTVEIVRDGRLERVYFRILTSSQENLYQRTRSKLIDDAVRTSDNERIQFFFHRALEVILELDVYRRLRRHIFLYAIHCCSQEVNMFSLLLILAINLTMLFTVTAPTSPYRLEDTTHGAWLALHILGVLNIVTESLMFIQSFIGPAWANLLMGWERWRNAQFEFTSMQTLSRLIARPPQQEGWVEVTRKETERHVTSAAVLERGAAKARLSWPEKAVRSLVFIFRTGTFVQHLVFLFFCVMGFVHSPIWYAAQLLQVLLNSTVLEFMFRSLSVRAIPLFLAFCTLFFAVYFFSTITYYNYAQLVDPLNSGSNNGFNCYSLRNCWMVHVDTLRRPGGIGDAVQWPTFYSKDQSAYGFFAFRIVYYIVLSLMLNNLFLGVIIDSLSESRARRQHISSDQTKKCFICGQERNMFDVVQPGAYRTHITEEHNMWQYIYFLHYLSKKDPSTFTGQEAYVHTLVQLRDVTFFPIGKSLMLSAADEAACLRSDDQISPPPEQPPASSGHTSLMSDVASRRLVEETVSAVLAAELGDMKRLLHATLGKSNTNRRRSAESETNTSTNTHL